ncbi:hypothetical protein [Conexibacter sp. CPCC 206217]|uniref:hypothetical protein n=1 Tax=Conexibacter sp. CPCC 206217 TaxID=3064574 RepID=UPI00271E4E96|nr:hypothetical protein [Conexibacter sp. CPCC 206217]MDO8208875.1 hypothetical protein [Conexibacter sp. CPCC 206217]
MTTVGAPAERIALGGAAFFDHAEAAGWTDGLPVLEPTPEAVAALLATVARDPAELLGHVPPRWGELTVERAAINAVMAGCRAEVFPVVVAACEAMLDPAFNLFAVQATTNPVGPTVIVNGPILNALGISSGAGCLGPGSRANMTIGRALRLIMLNPGGAEVGPIDRATHGYPGKLSLCFGEAPGSPWPQLHERRGFAPGDSTVTLFQGTGTFNLLDLVSTTPLELLTTIAHSLKGIGSNNMQLQRGEALVVICPDHARILAGGGLTIADVQRFLWSGSTVRGHEFPPAMRNLLTRWRPDEFALVGEQTAVPLVRTPEEIALVVAGGSGGHSCYVPGFADGALVTRSIETKA